MTTRVARLVIVQTSAGCLSYRPIVAGQVVWSNRVHTCPEGDAGTRGRLAAWAKTHGYRIVEEGGDQEDRSGPAVQPSSVVMR